MCESIWRRESFDGGSTEPHRILVSAPADAPEKNSLLILVEWINIGI
jgi:hypothetical protein